MSGTPLQFGLLGPLSVSRDGVSAKTTGNLQLTGDYEEFGEVQEKRVIEGEGITCRYHGWNWDGEGRNVWVPTQRRAMAVFDLGSYAVRETNGRVLLHLEPDG